MSTKPQPEDFPTAWGYWQARRVWVRRHGGSIIGTLAIAVFFGAPSGSATVFIVLSVWAILATAIARSRP